jgi:hypothetical protein
MKSVADALRASLRERVMAMTPDERVTLTARLAESDLDIFCAARRMTRGEARQLLERQRESRRRPSCAGRGAAG